jgi:hypothetical protein
MTPFRLMGPNSFEPAEVEGHVRHALRQGSALAQEEEEARDALTGEVVRRLRVHEERVSRGSLVLPREVGKVSLRQV